MSYFNKINTVFLKITKKLIPCSRKFQFITIFLFPILENYQFGRIYNAVSGVKVAICEPLRGYLRFNCLTSAGFIPSCIIGKIVDYRI
ncbi:hypothetical protein DBT_0060 [Dissulfuribacter thermophilus]|uniref:Uncharacterized protein n=1 Tax=Dissulfuribacter thermophilus TaxID=1156395 RepID=A0A1B9F8N6_9BACT|nr:hypothetical protein [Dissulfuribacter thermophilus]OCC16243.1 hypothetical protein DBT_0060 [Dissulfuribacter thermophilus]